MVKSELVTRIVSKFQQLPEKDVELGINQILENMSSTLEKHGRIEIRGFGSFSLHYRPSRNAHNPRTGEKVVTIHKYAPHFKPGKQTRERINQALAKNIPILQDNREE
ncbi:MAG: integration host factor subunit beta [Coxiellaceae bacterium]|jgi:integration host factor subunit beta|nr:integration host factor subunit beta [Coxiellaceae bacterium]